MTRTALVFCGDCGRQTGTRSVPAMSEGIQTVICKECSWKRTFAVANDGYQQKQLQIPPRPTAPPLRDEMVFLWKFRKPASSESPKQVQQKRSL